MRNQGAIVTKTQGGKMTTTSLHFLKTLLLGLLLTPTVSLAVPDPKQNEEAEDQRIDETTPKAKEEVANKEEAANSEQEAQAGPPSVENDHAGEPQTPPSTTSLEAKKEINREPLPTLRWLVVLNPLAGWLHNSTSPTIRSKTAGGEDTTRQVTFTGSGWGAGLVLTGFYRFDAVTLQAVNISYLFPNVNSSAMWGNITQVLNSFNLPTFFDPYIGFSFAYIGTRSELEKYVYSVTDTRSDGTQTVGYAYFPKFNVNTRNYQYAPRVGVTFKLPIHNWRIRPYYEFLYEDLYAYAKTKGSKVQVFSRENGYRTDDIDLEFAGSTTTIYKSHVVGVSLGIDYHNFLQLYGNVYYNITHNLISARFMGTILVPRHWGLTITYEHQEMCMVKNEFVMFGPTFFFMPPKFMDRIVQMKDEAMERRRLEKEEQARLEAE